MNEHFLTLEQSLAVKELGFDEQCFSEYFSPKMQFTEEQNPEYWYKNSQFLMSDPYCTAPLKSQFFKWVREKYGIYSYIEHIGANNTFEYWIKNRSKAFDTFEDAENHCINKIIEILKKIKENDDMVSADIVGY